MWSQSTSNGAACPVSTVRTWFLKRKITQGKLLRVTCCAQLQGFVLAHKSAIFERELVTCVQFFLALILHCFKYRHHQLLPEIHPDGPISGPSIVICPTYWSNKVWVYIVHFLIHGFKWVVLMQIWPENIAVSAHVYSLLIYWSALCHGFFYAVHSTYPSL